LTQVAVEVLGVEYPLEEFRLDLIPVELTDWEVGGLTDPIGQLFSWLWDSVQSALSFVEQHIFGELGRIKDWLWGGISSAFSSLTGLVNSISSFLGIVKDSIIALGTSIANALSPILSAIGNVGAILAGFGNALGQIWTFIQGIGASITSALTGAFGVLRDYISGAIKGISDAIANLPRAITGIIQGIQERIGGFITAVQGGFQTLTSTFSNLIGSVGGFLSTAIAGIGSTLSQVWQGISGALSGVYNWIVSGLQGLWANILSVRDWLYSGIKTVAVSLTQIWDSIASMLTNIPSFFAGLWAQIQGGFTIVGQTLTNSWNLIQKFFTDKLSDISTGVGETKVALMGFINPLIDIGKNFTNFVTSVGDFLKDPLKPLKDLGTWVQDNIFKPFYDWGSKTLIPNVVGGLKSFGSMMVDAGGALWGAVIKGLQSLFTSVAGGFDGLLKWSAGLISPKSPAVTDVVNSFLADFLFKPLSTFPEKFWAKFQEMKKKGIVKPEEAILSVGGYLLESVSAPYIVSAFLRWAGSNLNTELNIRPFGVGATIHLKLGAIVKHLSRVIWKVPDIILSSFGYGLGMWIMQPTSRLINSFMRNDLPIEMPTLEEIRTLANRAQISDQFGEIAADLILFMEYYGYSDWTIDWNLGIKAKELKYLQTSVKDRFGKDRVLSLELRQNLPSGPEFAAMMVRDIFFDFASFQKAMLVQGYVPDVSKLYYMMRYRYPTMENLWQFVCRMAGGFGWIAEAPAVEADIGFAGLSPKAISEANSKEPLKGIAALTKNLLPYIKWHDYAPFAWMDNFTSDRLIMMDLMADIPTRIDARWMYKWSVINEDELMRITVAKGMHPDWVKKITVGEAMNALTEERTLARTGPLNVYESGFLTEKGLDARLSSLIKIRLFEADYEVKFLEGEKKLLMLRSLYDRAQNALRQLWGGVTMAITRSMRSKEEATMLLVNYAGNIKTALKLDIELDKTFLDVWLSTYEIRQEVDTIQRIRYWARTFIYRASQLAEAGEDVETIINNFASTARLTKLELDIMQSFAGTFVTIFKKNKAIAAAKSVVKAKMRRGEITEADALAELKKAGMSDNDAKAFIEGEIKFRTVSTDKLVSMAEYIPIDEKKLKDKMNAEGVPEDEQKMYFAYIVASELAEEMGKVVTELVTDVSVGKITVDDFGKALDQLATLNGAVKEELGVDWIVLSPNERELYVALAKLKRARAGK